MNASARVGRFYEPQLDVLRFVAFLLVFLHHAIPAGSESDTTSSSLVVTWMGVLSRAGAYGVDVFFVLSAYLITELLRRERDATGTIHFWDFYLRRALRIWPLYYAFLLLCITVVPLVLRDEHLGPAYGSAFALFLGNWLCAWRGYPASVAAPLWSVSVEEQFYLVWPLLLTRFAERRWRSLALGLLGAAFATRLWLVVMDSPHPAIWCNTLARLDAIVAGASVSFYLRGQRPRLGRMLRWSLILAGISALTVVGRIYAWSGPLALITYPLVAAGGTVLLVAALAAESNAEAPVSTPLRLLVYLGRISYGLYVFHVLGLRVMGALCRRLGLFSLPTEKMMALALIVLMAALSYEILERPFLRLKQRFAFVPSRPE